MKGIFPSMFIFGNNNKLKQMIESMKKEAIESMKKEVIE